MAGWGSSAAIGPAKPAPGLVALLVHGRVDPALRVDRELVRNASHHRVAGLLHHAVRLHDVDVEQDAAQRLAKVFLQHSARSARAREAVGSVAERAGSGVRLAVAKGLATERLVYSAHEARTSGDVDVLVHPDHFGQFGSLLAQIFDGPGEFADGEAERLDQAAPKVPFLIKNAVLDGVHFDVHTDIAKFGPYPVRQVDRLWERMVIDTELGMHCADAELSLILAVVHLARDGMTDLRRHIDVARLLQLDLDWDFIEDFAAGEGWSRAFPAALTAICDAVEIEFPPALRQPTGPRRWWADTVVWPAQSRLTGQHMRARVSPLWQPVALGFLLGRPVAAVAQASALAIVPPRCRLESTGMSPVGRVRYTLNYWRSHPRRADHLDNATTHVRRVVSSRAQD